MKTKIFVLMVFFAVFFFTKAQGNYAEWDPLFTTYEAVEVPAPPVYIHPVPNVYDNSITIIDNSYQSYAPSVTCTDSQKHTGQIMMVDTSANEDSIVDAEIMFKLFSNNTESITIIRLKLDGKWYPMNIEAARLSAIVDTVGLDRNFILDLMKEFNFIAASENVYFLF